MGYIKAEDILPIEIIALIQNYVDGQNIYIPRKADCRMSWGSGTDIRNELCARDSQIYSDFVSGKSVQELAVCYYLSEKSIHRIIHKEKKKVS